MASQLIHNIYKLNDSCLNLSNKINLLVHWISEDEFEITRIQRITFSQVHSQLEGVSNTFYVLRQSGEKERIKVPKFYDLLQFQNILRTPFPTGAQYQDLTEEIKVYELLDQTKGLNLVSELHFFCLKIEETLQHILSEVEMKMGLGGRAISLLLSPFEKENFSLMEPQTSNEYMHVSNQNQTDKYFRFKNEEPFLKNFNLEFELILDHERALLHAEEFKSILEKYFCPYELIGHSLKVKKTKDIIHCKEITETPLPKITSLPLFEDSKIISNNENKLLLFDWIKDSFSSYRTTTTTSSSTTTTSNINTSVQPKTSRFCNTETLTTRLLYRGSENRFSPESFHQSCDSQPMTIVLIRSSNQRIFGGFTPNSWNSKGEYVEDTEGKSFLFSLTEKRRFSLIDQRFSIFGHRGYGPRFGGGLFCDLFLSGSCNKNSFSFTSPSSYDLPSDTFLAGSRFFQVDEYEVWKIE